MTDEIYYILGGLLALYLFVAMYNKRHSKKRKSRSFMEGQRLKDRRDNPEKK